MVSKARSLAFILPTQMAEEKKEVKKKWTFYLACSKCSFRFSIQREDSDMNKVDITKMRCMECGSAIQWDTSNFPVSVARPSHEAQAKMNIEASREALRMANEMKRADAEAGIGKMVKRADAEAGIGKMVPVTSYQEGKNKGKTEMLPEKAIKSIEEKVKPIIEKIEK